MIVRTQARSHEARPDPPSAADDEHERATRYHQRQRCRLGDVGQTDRAITGDEAGLKVRAGVVQRAAGARLVRFVPPNQNSVTVNVSVPLGSRTRPLVIRNTSVSVSLLAPPPGLMVAARRGRVQRRPLLLDHVLQAHRPDAHAISTRATLRRPVAQRDDRKPKHDASRCAPCIVAFHSQHRNGCSCHSRPTIRSRLRR